MKYSVTILLFVAAAFWSSTLARPRNPEQQGKIDAATRWAIAEMEQLPEPHKTKLINELHEVQQRHGDNLMEYMAYVQSMLVGYVREFFRGKSDVDSNETVKSNDIYSNEIIYAAYPRFLISIAPPAHREALEKKYRKALEEADYENFDDYVDTAIKIFEEETGLDFNKIDAEYDEGKQFELGKKFVEAVVNELKSALEEDRSSKED